MAFFAFCAMLLINNTDLTKHVAAEAQSSAVIQNLGALIDLSNNKYEHGKLYNFIFIRADQYKDRVGGTKSDEVLPVYCSGAKQIKVSRQPN